MVCWPFNSDYKVLKQAVSGQPFIYLMYLKVSKTGHFEDSYATGESLPAGRAQKSIYQKKQTGLPCSKIHFGGLPQVRKTRNEENLC